LTVAVLATGCGTPAHEQALAHAKRWAAAHGEPDRISCSSGFKPPGALQPSSDFICLVRHSSAVCDQLYVRREHGGWLVSLRRRQVDCVQPL
jgi:hypothetical protein